MKRGQLLSQPFFYIFLVVVAAMVLIFGYLMIGKLINAECKVENKVFLNELEKQINEVYSIGFEGSSKECAIVNFVGQSKLKCEIAKPNGVNGLCFVDMYSDFNPGKITIKELRDELTVLKGEKDSNLFFVSKEGCEINSQKLNKLKIQEPFCFDFRENKQHKILLENQGKFVSIKKA